MNQADSPPRTAAMIATATSAASSCSQNRNTVQPASASRAVTRASRERLPLTFAASGEYAVPLDAMARLSVADRDFAGDDEMFSSGPFTFGERYTGQEIGETTSLKFENEEGRVWIFVRWE